MTPNKSLKWRFDVNTFRLLGRELITDRITAVFELVKNAYDANATNTRLNFYNIDSSNVNERKIVISDDGVGMTFEDVRDKWMVVGTNNKRTKHFSEAPFNRRFVGEKGIGRFAVDKLGERILIKTKKKGEPNWLNVNINWDEYEQQANTENLILFTDIENKYDHTEGIIDEQGTFLEISKIREPWSSNDLNRLEKELTKIVSPFHPLNPPFQIWISSDRHNDFKNKLVETQAIKYASHQAEIDFDDVSSQQEVLKFNEATGEIYTTQTSFKSFGPIKMKIFYFDEAAKRKYHTIYKGDDTKIDGVKIYRDGIVATPFAEFEADRNKKRDILGIDKRRWNQSFDKVGSREVIGIVDITKDSNQDIIDATNRQDFIDNQAYKDLKEFVIDQIEVFSKLKIYNRIKKRLESDRALVEAEVNMNSFTSEISKVERTYPQLKSALKELKEKSKQATASISTAIKEQKNVREEFSRKENIYLSLMSLQDYATHLSHAVRTSTGKIKRKAEFFKENFPNVEFDDLFKKYSVQIYEEMNILTKVIDFMLGYAGSNIAIEDISIKQMLEKLLFNSYKEEFEYEKVKVVVEIQDDVIIKANRTFVRDIFQNLVANSIKAIEGKEEKLIKCSGYSENGVFNIFFSDNGVGIELGSEEKIFDIYYTTTAEQGGGGLGLYIVKTRLEALKGNIQLVEKEFKTGATFKITLPFE